MATMYKGARRTTNLKTVSGSFEMHHRKDCPTLDEREALANSAECLSCGKLECASFILPWNGNVTPGRSLRVRHRISVLLEVAAYMIVVGMTLYSVAMNSLPILMSAMITAGLYIVLSHFYETAAKSRRRIAEENYENLISSNLSRN